MARQRKILDEILGWKAPVATAWKELTPTDNVPESDGNDFKDGIREILRDLVAQGRYRVNTKQVFELAAGKGIHTKSKFPGTSIGNLIYRTPGWKKTGKKGTFVYQGEAKA